MTFHLSVNSLDSFSVIGNYISYVKENGANNINITIDAKYIIEKWEYFQKTLFVAELLQFNGVFILGELDKPIKEKVDELFSKSVFNRLEKVVFPKYVNDCYDFPKRFNRIDNVIVSLEQTNLVRTIIVWNGSENLASGSKVMIEFFDKKRVGEVYQIQKVLNTDFDGSAFGIKHLQPGKIATMSITLDEEIDKYYYDDVQRKGVFSIIDENEKQLGYGIIIR